MAAVVAGASLLAACEEPAARLPEAQVRLDQTTVSGISAGGYMAGQFQMAHARDVIGAGIIAGGPYGCAESLYADVMPGPGGAFLNLSKAINGCMLNALQQNWGVPDPAQLAKRAAELAQQGKIDPVSDVRGDRIYLFTGTQDRTVVPAIVAAAADYYTALGVPQEQVAFVRNVPAGHAFVTDGKGEVCDETAAPYIVNCRYDQAGALLNHLYGPLSPRVSEPAGQLDTFDQGEFVKDLGDHGLGDAGLVYIPPQCRASSDCRVHVVFHGCAQNKGSIGTTFATDTGYLPWADSNALIVLFPQVKRMPANPQACWDWWGYTGREFLTQAGPQIIAVRRMLERLAAPRSMI